MPSSSLQLSSTRIAMSSSSPHNASNSPGESTLPGPEEKPRLTEEEKKQNHIASEQKRRQAIREGFDRLTELVPGLEGQGRSEGLVLKRTVEYMRQQLEERRALIERIEKAGGHVDEELKKSDFKSKPNPPSPKRAHDDPSQSQSSPADIVVPRTVNGQNNGRDGKG